MSVSLPQPASQVNSRTLLSNSNRQMVPDELQDVPHGLRGSSTGQRHLEIATDILSDNGGDMSSYGFGMFSSSRRMREFIPESKKDNEYWMKRQKNNEAAKRSREKRRANDAVMAHRIHELSSENKRLKLELIAIRRQFGLDPGSYVMPSETAASLSSDDGLSSPQSQNTPYDLPVELLCSDSLSAASYSRQSGSMPEGHFGLKHMVCYPSTVQPNCESTSLDNSPSCDDKGTTTLQSNSVRCDTAPLTHYSTGFIGKALEERLDSGKLVGLQSTTAERSKSSYAIVDQVDRMSARDGRTSLMPSAMELSHLNDAFSLVFSDVSSSDDSDSYDGVSSSQLTSAKIAMGGSLYRRQVSCIQAGHNSNGEVPLNLSAVSCRAPCCSQQDIELNEAGVHYRPSSRLWSSSSVSPNGLKLGCQSLSSSSVTGTLSMDMSADLKFMQVNEIRLDRDTSLPEMPKMVSNSQIIASGLPAQPAVQAALGIDSTGSHFVFRPPVAASHSSVGSSAEVSDVKEPIPSAFANNGQSQGDFSHCNNRLVRRGVPLKVWRKLAASRAESDECQMSGNGSEKGADLPVAKCSHAFERRNTMSMDYSSCQESSQPVAILFDNPAQVHSERDASHIMKQDHEGVVVGQLSHSFPTYSVASSSLNGSCIQMPGLNVASRIVR